MSVRDGWKDRTSVRVISEGPSGLDNSTRCFLEDGSPLPLRVKSAQMNVSADSINTVILTVIGASLNVLGKAFLRFTCPNCKCNVQVPLEEAEELPAK